MKKLTRLGSLAATATVLVAGVSLSSPPQAGSVDSITAVWEKVAKCESGGNWSINTGNGYYGGLQFSYSTWRAYGGATYASTANRATKAQQIAIARRTLYAQGPGAWPVCSRVAGLTKTNGGASPTATPIVDVVVTKTTYQPPARLRAADVQAP